ncbi:hypothetical protein F0562_035299 [Nyssa sinensis]|uniref:Pentatricopeptide repeat-containing protein n=1 Tax=Nyssa sinensis TaxID=561372 RepID=A0A5J5AD90_9ASTE|nr:hypothetical protein F0562_035299 [Nyssa sinensis]
MIFFSAHRAFIVTHLTSRNYTSTSAALDPSLSLLQLLQFSIDKQSLKLSQQSHARVCRLGFDQHAVIVTKLISAYSVCKIPVDSQVVFDLVRVKNVYLWNTLINGHAKNCLYNESLELFKKMCRSTVSPDNFTFSTLSKVSGDMGDLPTGNLIHGKCIRFGYFSDIVVANSLMSMYCKCGNFVESLKLFEEMPQRNVSSWNVIIAGFAVLKDSGFDLEIWKTVKYMQVEGMRPDAFSVSSLLPLCHGDTGTWDYGRELHCYIVKNELDLGRQVFDQMKCRNVFAWTAMINGYVQNGASDEALVLFSEMQVRDGIEPNRVSLISILPACSSLAGLMGGKQIHGFSIRRELNHEVSLCNALIDMYSKCGSLNYARGVFEDDSLCKDAISWSSMISGYGLHGEGQEAILLYDKMLQLGTKPDMITLVGVLSACGRSGLVNEGLKIYRSIVNDYGIKPTLEICACMVDMLGRSGQLDQALDFINTMPVEPGPSVWGALVSASILHGNSEMQDLAYKFLIQIEPENPSNYVSLSNSYASSWRWDVVAEVRTMMKERGLRKLPGCSWININSKTHNFYVADKAHPCSVMIYEMLDKLILAMKAACNSPDFEIDIDN